MNRFFRQCGNPNLHLAVILRGWREGWGGGGVTHQVLLSVGVRLHVGLRVHRHQPPLPPRQLAAQHAASDPPEAGELQVGGASCVAVGVVAVCQLLDQAFHLSKRGAPVLCFLIQMFFWFILPFTWDCCKAALGKREGPHRDQCYSSMPAVGPGFSPVETRCRFLMLSLRSDVNF